MSRIGNFFIEAGSRIVVKARERSCFGGWEGDG
jgi:hypothetical protein